MARTIEEIYDSLNQLKDNSTTGLPDLKPNQDTYQQLIQDINSGSHVSVHRRFLYIFAYAGHTLEKMWDIAKGNLQEIARTKIPPTTAYYRELIFRFQWDTDKQPPAPSLVVLRDFIPTYDPVDESLQIVKRCAIVPQNDGSLVIKVAGQNNAVLSQDQLDGIASYLRQVGYPGIRFVINSQSADLIKLAGTVYYDAQVPQQDVQNQVTTAINNYLANLTFNGTLYTQRIIDAIQSVNGVIDVELTTTEAKPDVVTANYQSFGRLYQADAGHAIIDSNNPLSQTMSFQANV